MAITCEVTLESISDAGKQYGGKMLIGSARLKLIDNALEVLNQTFSAPYKEIEGLTVQQQLNRWAINVGGQMQDAIDSYVREKALKSNPAVDTTISAIESGLTV